MEEIYVNVERSKPVELKPSTTQSGPRSSERRFHGVIILLLGLLSVFLLAGLIGLGVHYYLSIRRSAAELSAFKANMTENLLASESEFQSLTKEIYQLKTSLTEVTKELHALKNACPTGWRLFKCSCYLLSNKSDSWNKGRDDCRSRGAHLVVIESTEEQTFLSNFTETETMVWIGLTDTDQEGTWKWVNGAPLTLKYWRVSQPDNHNGDEDCAHIITSGSKENWNDLSCENKLKWICEKSP